MNIKDLSIQTIKAQLAEADGTALQTLLPLLDADGRKGVQALAAQARRQAERSEKEAARIEGLWRFEDAYAERGHRRIAGTDEAGRGPLAGPVVAAAVILPRDVALPGINDSKKLSAQKRENLYKEILKNAHAYGIAVLSAEEIDRVNIAQAADLAMARAVAELGDASLLLVDGNNHPPIAIEQVNIIGGDRSSISIAAASILAKVYRDHLMVEYDKQYPAYGFAQHKGYGTEEHYAAIKRFGPSPIHRRSFDLHLR